MKQVEYTKKFLKTYSKLPQNIKRKVDKQIIHLVNNPMYPSLHTKRMEGSVYWEARVDKHYRFTFETNEDIIILRTLGPHDEGLGKK